MNVLISDLSEYQKISKILVRLNKIKYSPNITIAFEPHFARPIASLVVGFAIKQLCDERSKQKLSPCRLSIKETDAVSYLSQIGFFRMMGFNRGRYLQNTASTDRYMSIHFIDRSVSQQEYISSAMSIAVKIAKLLTAGHSTQDAHELYTYIFRELIRNYYEHSQGSEAYLYGQRYSDGTVEVAIVDNGIGIRHSLIKRYPDLITDYEAIRLAIEPGVTASASPGVSNVGFGLYVLSRLGGLKGLTIIGSGGAEIIIDNDDGYHKKNYTAISGTYVGFIQRRNIKNVERLLEDIVKDGEIEAKELHRASGRGISKRLL